MLLFLIIIGIKKAKNGTDAWGNAFPVLRFWAYLDLGLTQIVHYTTMFKVGGRGGIRRCVARTLRGSGAMSATREQCLVTRRTPR